MLRPLLLTFVILLCNGISAAAELVVAFDGSGQFQSIQQAVDSIATNNHERVIVHVKNGAYREQVRLHNSFITLSGEDRKLTKIVAEVDTSACPTNPGESKEEHCATIIGDGTDLVFENLTIENPYHGKTGKGAALSLVNDSTRIVISNVDVIGYGGDTLTLSARRERIGDGGDYYLNDVYVSGTYHIIVPRGAAYVVNSNFWCLGGEKNCLFAEGITRSTDKLVIRKSIIDGPEPFGLGSYFRDAAWYFVEDTFSDKLLPGGSIQREPATNYEMKWGEGRVYFVGNKGPDYPWLRNNLAQSPVKSAAEVTAKWVFPRWNPESTVGPRIERLKKNEQNWEVIFNESVTVEGHPYLTLAAAKRATYVGGSGSDTLIFHAESSGKPTSFELQGGAIFASGASLHRREGQLNFPH